MRVNFTQYLRPDGHKLPVYIELDPKMYFGGDLSERVKDIVDAGFEFAVEMLVTGQVALSIGDNYGDYAIKICNNDDSTPSTVLDMITQFSISGATVQRNLNKEED